MSVCAKCSAKVSCGCQLKAIPGGQRVCTNCFSKYKNTPAPAKSPATLRITAPVVNRAIWMPKKVKQT